MWQPQPTTVLRAPSSASQTTRAMLAIAYFSSIYLRAHEAMNGRRDDRTNVDEREC